MPSVPFLRAQVVQEADGWSISIPGLPIAAEEATFDAAVNEIVEALREYAEDWQARLLHARTTGKTGASYT